VQIKDSLSGVYPAFPVRRRSIRYHLDVPLRVIQHTKDATLLRDGRGTEISECGMRVMVGMELSVGEQVEIEFTPPDSEPIRVASTVRNRKGYRYGCEFIGESLGEHKDVTRLRVALQTFAAGFSSGLGENCGPLPSI
jgi:PilZ domain